MCEWVQSSCQLTKRSGIDPKNTVSRMLPFAREQYFYFLGAFFLPATVLRLPLRVRLLVRVR